MKRLKQKINKTLINFLNKQNASDIKSGREEIVSSFENDKFSIDRITRKRLVYPTDPERFDLELVGDYDAVWYYKDTKKKVSKKKLDAWFDEFVLVDVKYDSWFHKNEQFTITDNGEDIFIHLYGSASELYNIESEFYCDSYHNALNKCLEDAGIEFDPYSRETLQVVAQ
tara:strand:+ start:46 stop:555 length:510 start_codon:yes stop_codon:yes gene_type:complete